MRARFQLLQCRSTGRHVPPRCSPEPAEYQGATLSPTGEYVAVTTPFEERRALSIIKLSGNYERSLIKFDAKEQPYNRPLDRRFAGSSWRKPRTTDSWAACRPPATSTRPTRMQASTSSCSATVQDQGNVRSRVKDEGYCHLHEDAARDTKGEALFYYVSWTHAQFEEHHFGVQGRHLHGKAHADCDIPRPCRRERRQQRRRAIRTCPRT